MPTQFSGERRLQSACLPSELIDPRAIRRRVSERQILKSDSGLDPYNGLAEHIELKLSLK